MQYPFPSTSSHHSLQSIFSPSPTIPALQSPLPGLPLQPPFCSTPNQLHTLSPTSSSCSHVPQQTQSQYHPIHPPLELDDLAIENMLSDQSLWEDLKTDNEVITSESPYVSSNTPFNSPPFVPPPPKQSSFTHHPAPEQSLFTPLSVPEFSSVHPPVPRPSIQPLKCFNIVTIFAKSMWLLLQKGEDDTSALATAVPEKSVTPGSVTARPITDSRSS